MHPQKYIKSVQAFFLRYDSQIYAIHYCKMSRRKLFRSYPWFYIYIYIYIPCWYGFVSKDIYDRLLLKTWYIKKTMTKILVQWWVMIIKVYLSTRRLTLLKDCQISRHEHTIFVLHGNEYYAISVDQRERSMGQWPLMAITMDRRPEDSHGSQMLIDIYWPTIQFRGVLMSWR